MPSTSPFVIEPLTRARAQAELPRLLELDRGTPGEPWDATHWLADLPVKWELSRVAVTPAGICGFIVASRKRMTVHIHRVAVSPASRGRGIGAALVAAIAGAAPDVPLSLKVEPTNVAALSLYDALGFTVSARTTHQVLMEASPRGVMERFAARAARPAAP